MQQRTFMITVMSVNVLFVLVQLDKRVRTTHLAQHKETLIHKLHAQQQKHLQLAQELAALQSVDTIKQYALRSLHMLPIADNRQESI